MRHRIFSDLSLVPIKSFTFRNGLNPFAHLYCKVTYIMEIVKPNLGAIRPPTVPKGQARLRATLIAIHSPEQIGYLIEKLTGVTMPAEAVSSPWPFPLERIIAQFR